MTTQAKLDAAYAAVKPIVESNIAAILEQLPTFARRPAHQAVTDHQAQIEATVREILKAGIEAAATVE